MAMSVMNGLNSLNFFWKMEVSELVVLLLLD